MTFEFVEEFVGGNIPDDDGGICRAGDENGSFVDGGCKDRLEEISVACKFSNVGRIVEWDGIDEFIPAAREKCLCL